MRMRKVVYKLKGELTHNIETRKTAMDPERKGDEGG